MKKGKNTALGIACVENKFFSICSREGRYHYYINFSFGLASRRRLVASSVKLHPTYLNKYTLAVISCVAHVISIAAILPYCIGAFIYIYLDGAKNFVNDWAWQSNVRLFTYTNLFLVIILSAIIIYQNV